MKKEFIPYEQAIQLKDLGFDEKCFCYFDNKKELRTCIGLNNWNNHEGFPLFVSAPLYQQAFRFFREKYDITYSITGAKIYFKVNIDAMEFGWYGEIDESSYNSYEEAELACLKKLIELVKNK